ncbi:hypothetical protein MSIM_45260 [Mycobacterium simiae]|nr:hypothetical protein MSIM_45260 [Mycobacterium simiae]
MAAIDADARPNHGPLVSIEIVAAYEQAAASKSEANSSQAAAAAIIGSEPGPA